MPQLKYVSIWNYWLGFYSILWPWWSQAPKSFEASACFDTGRTLANLDSEKTTKEPFCLWNTVCNDTLKSLELKKMTKHFKFLLGTWRDSFRSLKTVNYIKFAYLWLVVYPLVWMILCLIFERCWIFPALLGWTFRIQLGLRLLRLPRLPKHVESSRPEWETDELTWFRLGLDYRHQDELLLKMQI